MTTYKDSGVDIDAGNSASKIAYDHAKTTFRARAGVIGTAVIDNGGFAGLIDMGDDYLVQCDDGTGSKMDLGVAMGKYDTLGYDLLAMVADDAICTGAEVIAVSNTLDVPRVDTAQVDALLGGLARACQVQRIIIPGGEIAEVPGAVTGPVWNATAVGIVAKNRVIDPATIDEGDIVIALRSAVARSNGFSLIRKILTDAFGADWHRREWRKGKSWGEVMLTPSIVYHGAVLGLIGRHGEQRKITVKGIAHITGGGIAENFHRVLRKSGLGANLSGLWEPHDAIKDLIELGSVPMDDAYRTWNMGNGMLMVVAPDDSRAAVEMLNAAGVQAKPAGVITRGPDIVIAASSKST